MDREEAGIDSRSLAELHPITARLLVNRGITGAAEVEAFLNPDWETDIHDPFLFSHMRLAVERVFEALEIGERLTVHGDYDADGVAGSAIVIETLRKIESARGAGSSRVDSYIPHRDKEGYGLHAETIPLLKERGTTLLITVDCGVASVEEIALARSQGIDAIVLDHHQIKEKLPDAILIHSRLPGETYPFKNLAAVAVAWKFACALLAEARKRGLEIQGGWEKWLLDLVAIATVTDMVPLLGENRTLLKYGLLVLNKTRRLGLRSLVESAGRQLGALDSQAIGFSLGPRINAAGRMDHANKALGLLLADAEDKANALVAELEGFNRARQLTTFRMLEDIEANLVEHENYSIIVLWNDEWSPALVGLVAGKFFDRFGKPCVAIGKFDGQWIGSGRSLSAYDITAALSRAGEGMLARVGGHEQACGFSLVGDEQVAVLAERLRADAGARLPLAELGPQLEIDAALNLEDLNWKLVETLERFEPFGVGNPRPLFQSNGLEVMGCGGVGQTNSHLRCLLRAPGGQRQKFIGFKLGERLGEMSVGKKIDVVYDIGVNEWNGQKSIECRLADFRPTEELKNNRIS